ncbi:MAG: efflux transporter outer membrane subunit [Gammaproteobacteria bacterium]|nr:efflux transporter outer membrane subunit [Gammaproteobacteria bacterium]
MNALRPWRYFILLGGIIVAGCAVGPDYQRPATALPAQYNESASATEQDTVAVTRDWWKLFNDATLNELMEKALQNNADVQLAVARMEEADAALRATGAALFPEIDLGASGTRSRSSVLAATPLPPGTPVIRKNIRATVGTAFELDFWGKLRRASEAARAQVLASRYAKDTVELTLAGLIVQSYLSLRALDAQIILSRNTLSNRQAALTLTQHRADGGIASELDVQLAEGARAVIAAQIIDLEQQRALAQHQLAFLSGSFDLKVSENDLRQLPVPPLPPPGLPSSLLESRPDVRQAEAQLIAANAKIGVAKAAYFPSISLTGNYGGESKALSDLFKPGAKIWSTGIGLNLPIFDAGRISAQVDQARAQQKQAIASYQRSLQNAFKDVNDALVTVRQTTAGEVELEARQRAAEKALALSEIRYKAGYSAYLEVLDAQRTLNEASLALVRNRQARLSATVDLFKAIGGGWSDI